MCDLENKLEFQRGQVKRFEVRPDNSLPISTPAVIINMLDVLILCVASSKLLAPSCDGAPGAGVAFKGQRGSSGRGAGAECPG